jgi:DNA topoisomerase-1
MQLVIVESPTKSKTIAKFLGKKYKVVASFGHVRDLPKRELGVDVEKNFEPKYIVPTKAKKVVAQLKKDAAKADEVILATDEDREGEAISWHLQEALKLKDPKRIVFHEITKHAIEEALEHPRTINMSQVNAQQARRILDRIVGYKLSPFLWKKVAKGLSAGRVQSVAVRLVCEKEAEIKKFVATEYWEVAALLKKGVHEFEAQLSQKNGKVIDKLEIKNKEGADSILKELEGADYQVSGVEKKETKRNPLAPFTTSTLQQAAANKFGWGAKMTMMFAQKLYEEGHITYHRTDSLNLSELSLGAAKTYITEQFGETYYRAKKYHAGKGAQEAHEAIRPTVAGNAPESLKDSLDAKKLKLYTLIWQRFVASQMTPAVFDATKVDIQANDYTFSANGQILKFDGFLKVYQMKFTETEMPDLKEKDALDLVELKPTQHFTEPPARYNEASLIKTLEKFGIGRPSTYAPIISTIQDRNYVMKNDQKRFEPTEMGTLVNGILVENFPQIVDIDFTANMEKELDEISQGKDTWQKTLKDFYFPFEKNLKEKYDAVPKENLDIKTDKVCPECGSPMIEKMGRFGRFYACTNFPTCKHTESLAPKMATGAPAVALDIACPKCGEGKLAPKRTKRGKIFYGCNRYPKCDYALWDKPTGTFCEKCKSMLVEKGKDQKICCSNKECENYKGVS